MTEKVGVRGGNGKNRCRFFSFDALTFPYPLSLSFAYIKLCRTAGTPALRSVSKRLISVVTIYCRPGVVLCGLLKKVLATDGGKLFYAFSQVPSESRHVSTHWLRFRFFASLSFVSRVQWRIVLVW